MKVAVAYGGPEGEAIDIVDVPAGARLADAVGRAGLVVRFGLDLAGVSYAIFGERATPQTPLREGDRIELLRPLLADPKAVRRQRAAEKPLPRPRPQARKRRRLP